MVGGWGKGSVRKGQRGAGPVQTCLSRVEVTCHQRSSSETHSFVMSAQDTGRYQGAEELKENMEYCGPGLEDKWIMDDIGETT